MTRIQMHKKEQKQSCSESPETHFGFENLDIQQIFFHPEPCAT